jgi:hypothetical protein
VGCAIISVAVALVEASHRKRGISTLIRGSIIRSRPKKKRKKTCKSHHYMGQCARCVGLFFDILGNETRFGNTLAARNGNPKQSPEKKIAR